MTLSNKRLLVLGIAVLAFVWVFLMDLVGRAGRSHAPPELVKLEYDGKIKASITSMDKQAFTITLTMKVNHLSKDAGKDATKGKEPADGPLVEGLTDKDFFVTEDGRPVPIDKFTSAGRAPIRICLLMDTSQSMQGDRIVAAKKASLALLDLMRDDVDELGLWFFAKNVTEVMPMGDLTRERREQATKAIEAIQLTLGTEMFGCLSQALDKLKGMSGRRIIVMLTDGMPLDLEIAKLTKSVLDRSKEQSIPLYTVGLGPEFARTSSSGGAKVEPAVVLLDRLAAETHGKFLAAPAPDQLKGAFVGIGESLQKEYVLTFRSPNPVEDGITRRVEVAVRNDRSGAKTNTEYPVPGVITTGVGRQASDNPAAETAEGAPFVRIFCTLGVIL